MSLWESIFSISELSIFNKRYDNDYIDRLNHRYSAWIFLILGLILGVTDNMENPVYCWTPAEFALEWVEYVNKVCWASSTYYVPIDNRIPDVNDNRVPRIAYYQWVPIVLIIQGILFILPDRVWKTLNNNSGLDLHSIIDRLIRAESDDKDGRQSEIKDVAVMFINNIRYYQEYRTNCLTNFLHKISHYVCIIWGKRYGNYLVAVYLLVKLLYICNTLGQLLLLNYFLGDGYYLYGYEVVRDLAYGRNWTTSSRFPRVTLCDFQIRSLGNRIHDYTVQCTLPRNLFVEKIYIFVWFWLVFILLLNLTSLGIWMWALFRHNRLQYARKYLKIMKRSFGFENETMLPRKFCETYMKPDGYFILRLVSKNTSAVTVGEIVQSMWNYYSETSIYWEDSQPIEEHVSDKTALHNHNTYNKD